MRAAVRAVIDAVEQYKAATESRQRGRGKKEEAWHLAIEAIVCNLAGLTLDPFSRALAVPRSSGVMWSGTMYAEPVYGAHFLEALDTMAESELGLIKNVQRGYSIRKPTLSSERNAQPSTILPGPSFALFVEAERTTWDDFVRVPAREIIVLKEAADALDDENAKPIDYPADNPHAREWRKEVAEINDALAKARFWLLPANDVLDGAGLAREPVDPTRRPLRRIFGGGALGQGGGRLFGGFWIDMPRAERWTRLRIASKAHPEGEPIAIVDMRQFNPRAAYAFDNLPIPDSDLYDIRGDGSCRQGFKQLVNVMLSTRSPLTGRRWPRGLQAKFPPGTHLPNIISEVVRYHAPIAHHFGSGFGSRLAMIESTILVDALLRLFRTGITALPIHDAVVVARSEALCANAALYDASGDYSEEYRAWPKVELSQST